MPAVRVDSSCTVGQYSLLLPGTARYRYMVRYVGFLYPQCGLAVRAQLVSIHYSSRVPLGIVTWYDMWDFYIRSAG